MTDPGTISADYTLRPSELAATLALLVEARQPCVVWGPPGSAKGRGGTDFRPGFAWLDEQGIRPSVCLYLTDMLCSSYPDAEPAFPVLWVNYSEPPADWNREPWGERIDIAPDLRASP